MWLGLSQLFIIVQTQMVCYLKYRQRNAIIQSQSPPDIFRDHYTDEEFAAARAYEFDKINFSILKTLISGFIMIIFTIVLKYLWRMTATKNIYIHSVLFTILAIVLYMGSSIPLDYYSTFVIEEKHGFNNTTLELFIKDNLIKLAIVAVACIIVIPVLVLISEKAGSTFIICCVVGYFALVIILQLLFPVVIYPLFTKLTPLTEGPVYDSVMKLAKKTEFPLKEIYVADDSKRSAHQNAMIFGLVTKRISLADTLLNTTTAEDITAVVGHEVGHSKHHHIPKMIALDLSTAVMTFTILFFILKSEKIFKDFGIRGDNGSVEKPIIIGLIIMSLITTPVDTMLKLPINMCLRHFEYQADAYSASMNLPIDTALLKIGRNNFMAIEPDPLFSAFTHSHPTLIQRVKAIRELTSKYD